MTDKGEQEQHGMEEGQRRSPTGGSPGKKTTTPPKGAFKAPLYKDVEVAPQRGRRRSLTQEGHDISRERSASIESDLSIGEFRFGDVIVTPKKLTGRCDFSDTAALSNDQAHLVIKSWCDVAGVDYTTELDAVDDITSAILLWYAKNTTSQRIDDSQYVDVEINGARRRISIKDCSEAMKAATGVSEDRRIIRVFADLIHRLLVVNTDVRPKMMNDYGLPAWMRTWAFDVAEHCKNPPPSSQARGILEGIRQQTLARAQINDATGRNGEKPRAPPELISQPQTPYRD